MQIVLFNPDICTLLLRYRQRDDRLCRLDILFPDSAQPVVETLGLDSVFPHTIAERSVRLLVVLRVVPLIPAGVHPVSLL